MDINQLTPKDKIANDNFAIARLKILGTKNTSFADELKAKSLENEQKQKETQGLKKLEDANFNGQNISSLNVNDVKSRFSNDQGKIDNFFDDTSKTLKETYNNASDNKDLDSMTHNFLLAKQLFALKSQYEDSSKVKS